MNTWTCPHCGEAIEDTFETCWKCGTSREGAPPADPSLYDPATRDALTDPNYDGDAWVQSRQLDPFGGIFSYQPEMVAPPSPPCPICHFTEYAWGRVAHHDNSVIYLENNGPMFDNAGPIRVRRCVRCGNLQMFV